METTTIKATQIEIIDLQEWMIDINKKLSKIFCEDKKIREVEYLRTKDTISFKVTAAINYRELKPINRILNSKGLTYWIFTEDRFPTITFMKL